MDSIQIITTKDGSSSLLNTALNETYHSIHGAQQESQHVFIKMGFDFLTEQTKSPIKILEIGFGTGLNAILTFIRSKERNREAHYVSLETYPISEEVWCNLNYDIGLGSKNEFEKMHAAEWNNASKISDLFTLHKINQSIQEVELVNDFDLVYFDAFAPNKQPEMWEPPVLQKVYHSLKQSGVFVTYCAKGQVKRDLKTSGFHVESLQGPPGKREMIRAHKNL